MTRRLALVLIVALAALGAASPATACCVPCQNFCTKTTPPDTVCCTGIPVPGDACGHTTCGKWLRGPRPLPDAEPVMTPVDTRTCDSATSWPDLAVEPAPVVAPATSH
jgi:hypothetical protein